MAGDGADNPRDPQNPDNPVEPQELTDSGSRYSVERRKFLTLLGAAGAYATPAIAGLLGSSRTAFAQASSASASPGGGTPGSSGGAVGSTGGGASSESETSETTSEAATETESETAEESESAEGTESETSEETESGTETSESESSSGPGISTSSGPSGPRTYYPIGDTFIRSEAPNTNEGGSPIIRVGVGPIARGLVLFDRNAVLSAFGPTATVTLALRIAANHNNWGQQDNRTVDVYPLLEDFVEGNGRQSGLPGSLAVRGTGHGATWASPDDPNVFDNVLRHASRRWHGGNRVGDRTAPGAVHINQIVEQDVTWDVTQDVLAGYPVIGWLIRVTDEGDDRDWDRHDRDDRRRGRRDDDRRHGRHDDDRRRRGFDWRRRPAAGDDRGEGGTVEYLLDPGCRRRRPDELRSAPDRVLLIASGSRASRPAPVTHSFQPNTLKRYAAFA